MALKYVVKKTTFALIRKKLKNMCKTIQRGYCLIFKMLCDQVTKVGFVPTRIM